MASRLLIENDQMILRDRKLGYTDRIAPKHRGSNIRWIITGAENDNPGAWNMLQ